MDDAPLRARNLAIVRQYIDAINRWDFDAKRARPVRRAARQPCGSNSGSRSSRPRSRIVAAERLTIWVIH
jgi:hypothetical protein